MFLQTLYDVYGLNRIVRDKCCGRFGVFISNNRNHFEAEDNGRIAKSLLVLP